MYCTMDLTMYCSGNAEEAAPKFQAMLDDFAKMLKSLHPHITMPDIQEPVTANDLQIGYDSTEDFDGRE